MIGYFRSLTTGTLPLSRVLWFDMLAVGTLVNAASLVLMLVLFAAHAPAAFALVVFLLPIPYNIALFVGVWRSSTRGADSWAFLARAVASIWLIAAVLLV